MNKKTPASYNGGYVRAFLLSSLLRHTYKVERFREDTPQQIEHREKDLWGMCAH